MSICIPPTIRTAVEATRIRAGARQGDFARDIFGRCERAYRDAICRGLPTSPSFYRRAFALAGAALAPGTAEVAASEFQDFAQVLLQEMGKSWSAAHQATKRANGLPLPNDEWLPPGLAVPENIGHWMVDQEWTEHDLRKAFDESLGAAAVLYTDIADHTDTWQGIATLLFIQIDLLRMAEASEAARLIRQGIQMGGLPLRVSWGQLIAAHQATDRSS